MAFYEYQQNNSGGGWDGPQYVFIEAASADEANDIAERDTVIYFDGVSDGHDCSCCGSRWSRAWGDEGYATREEADASLTWGRENAYDAERDTVLWVFKDAPSVTEPLVKTDVS